MNAAKQVFAGRRIGLHLVLPCMFALGGCAGTREASRLWKEPAPGDPPLASPQVQATMVEKPAGWLGRPSRVALPDVEQMIDDLDRMMTTNGTIGVKSPDVWGQDRLSKFRFEYETQMSEWVKSSFKGDVNALVRRGESEARKLTLGGAAAVNPGQGSGSTTGLKTAEVATAATTIAAEAPPMSAFAGDKLPVSLEPTVVLDEHSNYLNHLNQLRRINAGDDLTDRPGYGLYLVRIPVTLSPGPRSRRGKGAIITVSAKSLMTRDTMRSTLRNAVINETVNNLTQAVLSQAGREEEGAAGSLAGSLSLLAYADTEVYYGAANIRILRQEAEYLLSRDFADEPHHRKARIAEWLRSELESSYNLFEEKAGPARSGQKMAAVDPLEELGDLLMHRDYPKVAALQAREMNDSLVRLASGGPTANMEDAPSFRKPVTDFLAFALRIQAAAVNRRLKQDILDQDPTLSNHVNLKDTSFFDPQAPPQVISLFERYVEAKWPLRVYAIEPVIAQQNVADALSRRSQTSLELSGAGQLAPFKLLTSGAAAAGLATDRKLAEDETAIRLNPTMVGFGAGESTFGWVFYPRVQTRARDRGLFTSIALLSRGEIPDPSGKEQSIEPGQRECTALIVMPNFVPKLEFVTVANWFKTSEAGDGQKSDLEKASTLSRRLDVAENALSRVLQQDEASLRAQEYQIAKQRLEQLKSLMPTQRLVVSVPYTGDNNDSRIFCSQGGQLRPILMAWHGRPPEQNTESTILIEGKNFSVHDTHVIAGGKPARSVLVSRNVLEVTISPEACPTQSEDGRTLIDINIATPNGVSNHLLLPMQPPCPDRKKPVGESTAAKAAADAPTDDRATAGGTASATPQPPKSIDPGVKAASAEVAKDSKKK